MFTYKDFATSKIRRTFGRFEQWSEPTGPLHVRYAIFKTEKTRLCVPVYLLTPETRAAIPPIPTSQDAKEVCP